VFRKLNFSEFTPTVSVKKVKLFRIHTYSKCLES
jgi:hypothetical protein